MSESIPIEKCVVFRDSDWGNGIFDEQDVRIEVTEAGEIWPMCGREYLFRDLPFNENPIEPDVARSIAAILIAAADHAEGLKKDTQ